MTSMDPIITAFRSSKEEVVEKISAFNNEHETTMAITEPLAKKKQVIEGIFRYLRDPVHSDQHALCLKFLKILSRDKQDPETLFTPDRVETLLHLANLVGEEEAYMTDKNKNFDSQVVIEAQKCLCNLIFNSKVILRLCSNNNTIDGIMLRMKMYKDPALPNQVKYFDMRMMFFLTALCHELRDRVRDEYHGLVYLMEAIDLIVKSTQEPGERNTKKSLRKRKGSGRKSLKTSTGKNSHPEEHNHLLTDEEVDIVIEVLKILFNLTCNLCQLDQEREESQFMRLVAILHDLLLSETKSKDRRDEIRSHTVNLLTTMPNTCFDELLVPIEEIGLIDNPLYEYEDFNVEAIAVLVEFLEKQLEIAEKEKRPLRECLAPTLLCMSAMSRSKRIIRKYLRSRILPPLKDASKRPEDGCALRNQLVKLMTVPDTDVKQLVADWLFVLCKENVGRLIKYTGYGNAAGLLANRGLMLGSRSGATSRDDYSSESEDSETEEYAMFKSKINPVTGCVEEEHVNPLEGMSDEQKEYEARELVGLIEKMSRTGVVKPCRVGEDGKPHPVEHILQLRGDIQDEPSSDED